MRRLLIACGIASSMLYVVMNVFIGRQWQGYSAVSQTVSELSAIGAPTRPQWVLLAIAYALLITAFGYGIWSLGPWNRRLRVVGILLIIYGIAGIAWPFAPMHLRGAQTTLTDTLHIAFTILAVALMLAAMAVGAAAFGKRFRLYSIASLVLLVIFGVLTGLQGPRVAEDLPTPWIGVWERINIGVFMVWVVVLAARSGRENSLR